MGGWRDCALLPNRKRSLNKWQYQPGMSLAARLEAMGFEPYSSQPRALALPVIALDRMRAGIYSKWTYRCPELLCLSRSFNQPFCVGSPRLQDILKIYTRIIRKDMLGKRLLDHLPLMRGERAQYPAMLIHDLA